MCDGLQSDCVPRVTLLEVLRAMKGYGGGCAGDWIGDAEGSKTVQG